MRTHFSRSSWCLAAVAVGAFGAAFFTSADASAGGYTVARFGADHGSPAMPNTYAVYFNPGALGGTTGTTITGDVSVALRWVGYQRPAEALSPSDESTLSDVEYRQQNVGRANLLNLLAVPFAGVNTDFGGSKLLRAGFAVYVPFGGFATWDRRAQVGAAPGTTDGVQRWHNISGEILAIYNTFAFAVKVHPRFTIGANVSPVIHRVKTVRARNADGSDDTVAPSGLIEGRSLLEASGFNLSAALGVYWEPTDSVKLGLSYTSQPGFGETRMNGTLTTQIAGANPGTPDKVDFLQTYPDIIRFGAAAKVSEKLEIRGDIEFERWSVLKRQCVVKEGGECTVASDGRAAKAGETFNGDVVKEDKVILNVPRNWNNSYGIRVGPGYQLSETVELFGSVGFSTPAAPKETIDASTIDAYKLGATIGGKVLFSKHFAMAASYTHIHFFTVDTDGQSTQNIKGHPSKAGGDAGQYNASRSPSADGVYKSEIGFLNINAAYTF
jgi:long-chain fatty acid transport protein